MIGNGKYISITSTQPIQKRSLLRRMESVLRLYRMVFYLVCFTLASVCWGVMIGKGMGAASAFGRVSVQLDSLTVEVRRYNAIRYADDMVYRQALQKLSQNDSILSANYRILNLRITALEAQKKPQP